MDSERLGNGVDAPRVAGHREFVRLALALLFALVLCTPPVGAGELVPRGKPERALRLMFGDDPRFADPAFDDSNWERIHSRQMPARRGVYWVRARILPGTQAPASVVAPDFYSWPDWNSDPSIDAVFLAATCAYELYWDGQLLHRSGIVGNSKAEERPGPLDHLFLIPEELRGPGPHIVAVRVSSHHYNFPADEFGLSLLPVNYRDTLVTETGMTMYPVVGATLAWTMMLVAAVMWKMTDRRRTLGWCVALNALVGVLYVLVGFRWFYNAPYPWLAPRYILIALVFAAVCAIILGLLMEHLSVPRRRRWWIALAVVLVGGWLSSSLYELKALWMARGTLVLAVVLLAWAVYKGRLWALWVFLGVAVALVTVDASRRTFLCSTFLVTLEGLVLLIFAATASQAHAERKRARQAILTAARLESELLRKNLQPHFLLNTLATLVEVIEQEPKVAVSLIESLSDEFRALARISGETLIPLRREIDLCRAHLKVMSMRKGAACELRAEGVKEEALVPPALFHTLVENGLTHLLPRNGVQSFVLTESRRDRARVYELVCYGDPLPRAEANAMGNGTGLKYIRSRLEESFPSAWELDAGPVEGGWRTKITIKNAEAKVS